MQITTTDLTKTYGAVTALSELSLTVPSGATFGLLGTNGAGKSTLFRLLIGQETPDAGTVEVGDTNVATAGPALRERIGYLPEHVGFPQRLTGREVLTVHARMRGVPKERVDDVLETVGLQDAADRRAGGYSKGMGRRLGVAGTLLGDPDVLLLDEPTAGLDPRGVATFHRIVEDVSERTGATVVFSSHVLPEVEDLCDRVAVLYDGECRAAGTVEELEGPDLETSFLAAIPDDADLHRSNVGVHG